MTVFGPQTVSRTKHGSPPRTFRITPNSIYNPPHRPSSPTRPTSFTPSRPSRDRQARLGTKTSNYRGTSLTRKHPPLGPYRRPMPRVPGGRAFSYERGSPVEHHLEGPPWDAEEALEHSCLIKRFMLEKKLRNPAERVPVSAHGGS